MSGDNGNTALAALAAQAQETQRGIVEYSPDQIDLIKRTICRGASDDELRLFIYQARRMGLDPFSGQIHALKRRQKIDGEWQDRMSIQVGIDGYRLIADRTGCYAPGREPTFQYDGGQLLCATAYVMKLVGSTWHEIAATAFFSEYVQLTREGKPNAMWEKMPHSQLAKCAEALALRRAFPAELSGVYTDVEMEQADGPVAGEIVREGGGDETRQEQQQERPTRRDPPAKKVERPMSPEHLRDLIAKKAETHAGQRATEKQRNLLRVMFGEIFGDDDAKRHSVMAYLTGHESTKDCPDDLLLAVLDWLHPTQDSGGNYLPDNSAVAEAHRVVAQTMVDAGQGELPAMEVAQ